MAWMAVNETTSSSSSHSKRNLPPSHPPKGTGFWLVSKICVVLTTTKKIGFSAECYKSGDFDYADVNGKYVRLCPVHHPEKTSEKEIVDALMSLLEEVRGVSQFDCTDDGWEESDDQPSEFTVVEVSEKIK
eukprot:GHVU01055672.1.p1 GENE.GHVU01055672.1~~GHVU01055672.1.p1  ORF type:complete len:131 (+),score=17.43 GHVU01055672.1:106-498(+)